MTDKLKTIRIGVIGAGGIVTQAHLPAVVTQPNVQLAWIADKSAARARLVGSAYNIPGYGEEILQRDTSCDVVLMAAPYGVREPYFSHFSGADVAWYVEKPFARTAAEHAARCETLGADRVACGFQRRSSGLVRVAREAVRQHLFGGLRKVEMGFGRRGRILGGGTYSTDPKQAGGGILAEVGIHNIDAIFHLTKALDFSLEDARTVVDHGLDIHTKAALTIQAENAETIEFTFTVSTLVDTSESITLRFDHASLSFSLFGDPVISVSGVNGRSGFVLSDPGELYPRTSDQIFHAFWKTFLGGLRAKVPTLALARDSLLTTRLVEQIYTRSGKSAFNQ